MAKKNPNKNYCSFCGRADSDVNLLIAGVTGHICDMCVEQATDRESRRRKKASLLLGSP